MYRWLPILNLRSVPLLNSCQNCFYLLYICIYCTIIVISIITCTETYCDKFVKLYKLNKPAAMQRKVSKTQIFIAICSLKALRYENYEGKCNNVINEGMQRLPSL